jgi:CcmD family protein
MSDMNQSSGVVPAAPASSASPDSRDTQFQAVDGGTETHSGSTLLVEAYAVLWVILMGFVVAMWRKQSSINTRLDDLEKTIDRAAAVKKK